MAKKQIEDAADVAAEQASAPESDVQLVTMTKDGETLDVHPTCVEAHLAQRWKVVE